MRIILSISFLCFFSSSFAQKEIYYVGVAEGYIHDSADSYPHWKVVDAKGNILADSLGRFDNNTRPDISEGMFEFVATNGKRGFKNYHNEIVVPAIFTEVRGFKNDFAAVALNTKWGLIDKQGKFLTDTIYKYVSDMDHDGVAILVKPNNDLGCINSKGKFIVPFSYKSISLGLIREPVFSEGLLPVSAKSNSPFGYEDDKLGFINKKGNLVIDTIYSLGYSVVGDHRRNANPRRMCGSGYVALMEMENPNYLKGDFYKFISGQALVAKDGKVLVINTQGDSLFAIADHYGRIINSAGFFIVSEQYDTFLDNPPSPKMGVINTKGEMIIPLKFTEIGEMSDGYFVVKTKEPVYNAFSATESNLTNTEYMFFDTLGRPAFNKMKLLYVDNKTFFAGVATVVTKEKNSNGYYQRAMLTTRGKLISIDEDVARPLGNGLFIVSVKDNKGNYRVGCKGLNNEWVIKPEFYEFGPFENGFAPARNQGGWGYTDIKGNYIIQPRFQEITALYSLKIP
ncbi:MAG: WG repeat-containing protein [Flavipsychrobacter sp.]|nr:WG repeat-containing protein [Flavipsychrobacter sp.]